MVPEPALRFNRRRRRRAGRPNPTPATAAHGVFPFRVPARYYGAMRRRDRPPPCGPRHASAEPAPAPPSRDRASRAVHVRRPARGRDQHGREPECNQCQAEPCDHNAMLLRVHSVRPAGSRHGLAGVV